LLVLSIALGMTLIIQESPQESYERGKVDGQILVDSTKPYVTMELIPPSEIIVQIVGDDTLSFHRERTDTGYVLTPIYVVRKMWTPYRPGWQEDWLDTSRGWGSIDSNENGWYGWEISEKLARSWYDGVDSTHRTHEDAALDWAMSYLLRERKFVIYFDSTDTLEDILDWYGREVPDSLNFDSTDTMPAVERVDTVKSKLTLYLDSNWLRRLEIEEEVRGDERP